jgi:predicted lipoprotein with Yx(FWY)xxD motif
MDSCKFRLGGLIVLAFSAIAVAGCGGSAPSSSSTAAAATPAPSTSSSGAAIATAKGSAGAYLTAEGGRAVYLWVADTGEKSVCSGACAKAWPPVETKGTPTAGSGVDASKLGTTKRSDGSEQVTYDGHPLYYFIADKSKGQTTGQGSDGFGAKWWLVAPSGDAITTG